MTFPEIIKVIKDIEDNANVQNVTVSDISVWPLVRLQIWQQLSSPDSWSSPPVVRKRRFKKRLARILGALIRPNRYNKADALFLVGPNERRVQMNGAYYSQFADSLNDLAASMDMSTLVLDLDDKMTPTYGSPVRLSRDIGSVREKIVRKLRREALPLRGWETLVDYLRLNHPNIKLNGKRIMAETQSILFNERRFERILKQIQPRVAFLMCYYHPAAMGYTRACRKLNIKTVEVQHGQQGDYHGMYTNWTNIPSGGYDTMPTHFWCWGKRSADRINTWLPGRKAFVGGNPWLGLQKSKAERKESAGNTKRIFIGLQPTPQPILPFVVDAILSAPNNIRWHIGLHPAMKGRENDIRTLLGTAAENVDFELAKNSSLYETLAQMDFLLTQWSTVAYEALAFDVHPIVVHPNGEDTFRNYIHKGIFSYASTVRDLLNIIGKDSSNYSVREEEPYIVSDNDHVENTLRHIITS